MGDLPESVAPADRQKYASVENAGASQPQISQNPTGQGSASQYNQAAQQQAFPSQFEVTSRQSTRSREMAFHMGHMSNDLPQNSYRGGQVSPGYQQAFHPSSQAAMMQQMHHMQQYGNQSPQMPAQGFYGQTQMPQYYSTDQMNPHGPPPNLMVQPAMQYYAAQMPIAPQSPTYYASHQPHRSSMAQYGQQQSGGWQQNATQPPQRSRSHHQNKPSMAFDYF